jgi:predicted nucleotidyltransferase
MSNQSYKELAIPYFKEVFEIVDKLMHKHKIPYYLIGVSAIALELLRDKREPGRGTKDIDFAIMISSIEEYESLSESIVAEGFNKVEAPWTFYSDKFKIAIDVLPFGEIEENNRINFNERYTDLHVLGFKEVLEESKDVLIEDIIAQIPPLPGMVILKLVAWSDRPEERDNDLSDILRIIQYYFDLEYDEIVEYHHDTFTDADEFDPFKIASEVLGRKAKFYLDKSEKLSKRILQVIEDNLKEPETSKIAKDWARRKDWEIEYAFKILESFQKGLRN